MGLTERAPRAVRVSTRVAGEGDSAQPLQRIETRDAVIVDLNNMASFPTLAVGILTAALRNRGHRVNLISPLAHGVPASFRETRENWSDNLKRRVHLSDFQPFLMVRDRMRQVRLAVREKANPTVLREVARALDAKPDIILLSAYLEHYNSVVEIGKLAKACGVPVLLGGPMFTVREVADEWRQFPGVVAVVGAEADHSVVDLVESICSGREILDIPGVLMPNGAAAPAAAPLRQLDESPIPDFTDFPWDRYPVRIVPLMAGRGCQWDKCLFCSDVVSSSGRTFRTRSVENVLYEMEEQARRYNTTNFLFLDIKLNSYPAMIRGIAQGLQERVRGAEWIGTVHVDQRKDNGLTRKDLFDATAGGMRRVSFGLESGSQRLLDLMNKGCSVERNSQFIKDAYDAGLSIRCTMFKGFPGETAEDMELTWRFLEEHAEYLDRVRFNDFSIQYDTPIYRELVKKGEGRAEIVLQEVQSRRARVLYRNRALATRDYRRAKRRALDIVYGINKRVLRDTARQFDGLM